PEGERTYVLQPADGAFDELEEEFRAEIRDIVGGKEYKIVVIAKDQAGNVETFETKTPYIRQYENFGKTLLEKGIIIAASYYTWYRADEVNNWKDGYRYTPLLGEYSSSDEIVINKHVDWATGHGINTFLISWNGPAEASSKTKVFEDVFLNAYLVKNGEIKIAILYESGARLRNSGSAFFDIFDFNDSYNREIFIKDLEYMNKKYFILTNYLKIKDKPFIYFYLSQAYRGDFDKVFKEAKEKIPFFACGSDITPYIKPWEINEVEKRLSTFDAERSWVALWVQNDPKYPEKYHDILKTKYEEWYNYLTTKGVLFIPSLIPSFDSRYVTWGSKAQYPLDKNLEKFNERINIIFPYLNATKIVVIDTFNDWFESTNIEPSREFEFKELEILKKNLIKLLKNE
ncbi:hypothetical protein, partial [Pyrobaculum aerophilum]